MDSILQNEAMDRLPMAELTATLDLFLEPMLMHWPEKRLREVGKLAVQGILSGQSPLRIDCVDWYVDRPSWKLWRSRRESGVPCAAAWAGPPSLHRH